MEKFNHVLDGVKIPDEMKVYVNNYINESLELMEKRGHIEEFICDDKKLLNTLKQKGIICSAVLNDCGMLIPVQNESVNKKGNHTYIISDYVFENNGFKVFKE